MENKQLIKKWVIGGLITGLIIVLVIWYRNYRKEQEAKLAEQRLKDATQNNYKDPTTAVITNNTGKQAYILSPLSLYSTDGNFTLQVKRTDVGGRLGLIIADKTDSGSISWYKVRNDVGSEFYVAKFAVRVQ